MTTSIFFRGSLQPFAGLGSFFPRESANACLPPSGHYTGSDMAEERFFPGFFPGVISLRLP